MIADLRRCGLLTEEDTILFSEARVCPYANVIFDLERAPALKTVHGYLDDTGIGYYDEALFVKAMHTGYVGARPLRMPMPWFTFRGMNDDDLKSIFAYLRTLPPVHHDVDNTELASYCKKCRTKHGLGEHNDRYVEEAKK